MKRETLTVEIVRSEETSLAIMVKDTLIESEQTTCTARQGQYGVRDEGLKGDDDQEYRHVAEKETEQKMLKALEKEEYDDSAWKITELTVFLETD